MLWKTPFGPNARLVLDHADLSAIYEAGVGYVLNVRPEHNKLHTGGCQLLEIASTWHPKIYFDDMAAAKAWLAAEFGDGGWVNCGICGGTRDEGA